MKRIPMFILVFGLSLTFATGAGAEAPASQFGSSIWPYRVETSCGQKGTCAQQCTECGSDEDCISCPVCSVPDAPGCTPAPSGTPMQTATPAPTVSAPPAASVVPTATANPTRTPAPTSTVDYTTNSIAVQEQNALDLLNQDRSKNGLSALTLDPELSRLARLKSTDMKQNNYFAHTSPTYGSAADMLKQFGYAYTSVGENIAHHATVEKAQAAFMSSDGHRRNILGAQWTKVGIGVCYDAQGFVYVTQLFVR